MIKKTILMLLVLVGGVMTVQADDTWTLRGDFNNWSSTDNVFTDGQTTAIFEEGVIVSFKIVKNGSEWYGNNEGFTCYVNGSKEFTTDGGNCTLRVADAGEYTFNLTIDNGTPKVSITYPTATYRKVYLYNNIEEWTEPYMYKLLWSYWDNDNGSGSANQPNGVKMTQVGTSNVYEAEYRYAGSSTFLVFLKDKQDNYGNFWSTEAIYRGDFDNTSKVFVPNANGATETKNQNTVKYYKDGEWHAYPTYSRTVTDGNYGTICLPFDATVEGATVYKITGKVMESGSLQGINIEPVTSLEAGKAYIYKAAGATITATLTGNYSDATAGYGMMGNVSSEKVTIYSGYVIKDNKIRKINGGAAKIGQYKGYITLDGINEAVQSPSFIGVEETTDIDDIEIESNTNAIYDLQGHRVTNMKKGVYIINGKKVQVK